MHRGHTVAVRLKRRPVQRYDITIRPGLFADLHGLVARRWGGRDLFIISDTNVSRLYGRELLRRMSDMGERVCLLDVPAGERSKRGAVAWRLHTLLLSQGIRRDSVIIALGGGVVGDLAGYVAATVLRGVEFIQVPTTLLAQVDSSVGGKVGIDHPLGKNLIGAFHQPAAVFIDPKLLRSLSAEEFRNGLAEVVKIAAALDGRFFRRIERKAGEIMVRDPESLAAIIGDSVGLKAAVVGRDEFESGLRKTLNAGHTIGHAVEAAAGYSVKHGAAVAIGLVAESRIAERMGLLRGEDVRRLVAVLRRFGLPTSLPRLKGRKRFAAALGRDKKGVRGGVGFVLLNGIGSSAIGVRVDERDLNAVMDMMQ